MNIALLILLIAGAVILLTGGVIAIVGLLRAPEGYEDEKGFQLGHEDEKGVAHIGVLSTPPTVVDSLPPFTVADPQASLEEYPTPQEATRAL